MGDDMKYKISDTIEVEIKKIGINGEGVGYHNQTVVFVDEALPGEIVKIELTEVFPKMLKGNILEIIKASPDRREVIYPLYQKTGAFEMQHVAYEAQLKHKRDILINAFNRYIDEKIVYAKVKGTTPSNPSLGYRNKVSLPVRKIGGKNKFGLYLRGSNEFVPINDAMTQDSVINTLLQKIEELMDKHAFHAYIQKDKSGYMKSCVIRRTTFTNQIQISFLLMKKFDKINEFIEELVAFNNEIKSIYTYLTDDYKEQVFFTNKKELVYGTETITEVLNGFTFELYPESFFQLNTRQADIFYKQMIKMANLAKNDVVIDAYAGAATISHYASKHVSKVYAIEKDKHSATSAIKSLEKNNINNVIVVNKPFFEGLNELREQKIDVMFFDPPRTGLGETTMNLILKMKPKKIIYGSCNPSTLAKDLNALLKSYKMIEVQPIDMFAYSPLVESIVSLELK